MMDMAVKSQECAATQWVDEIVWTAWKHAEAEFKRLCGNISKRGLELRRDMEATLTNNQAKVAGDDTTARTMAGLPSWINGNVSAGAGATEAGSNGTQTRTDGTQRAFTEAQLKTVLAAVYDDGGNPSIVSVGTFNKQTASGFTGIATKFKEVDDMKTIAAADVYVSDKRLAA